MLEFVVPLPLGNLQGAISITFSVVLSLFVSVSFAKLSLGGMVSLLCKQLSLQGVERSWLGSHWKSSQQVPAALCLESSLFLVVGKGQDKELLCCWMKNALHLSRFQPEPVLGVGSAAQQVKVRSHSDCGSGKKQVGGKKTSPTATWLSSCLLLETGFFPSLPMAFSFCSSLWENLEG